MRCGDCNKFVGFDDSTEPEAELEVSEEGNVSGTVRVVLACSECGTELKEASFDIEDTDGVADYEEHLKTVYASSIEAAESGVAEPITEEEREKIRANVREAHELEVEPTSSEMTSRQDGKPGTPSRFRRTFYGYSLDFEVKCSCGEFTYTGHEEDDVQASGMDELQ